MTRELTFNEFIRSMNKRTVYMIIGNGTKNQFRDLRVLKGVISSVLKDIPSGSVFLYFGDQPNEKTPDIGYVFELIHHKRPDILINMIQINEAKPWGIPSFVNNVYWHSDYNSRCKGGGLVNGHPCSNTKKWISVHKRRGIKRVFILGGGEITLDEYSLVKANNIAYQYFPVERKYLGDGKTRVTNNDSKRDRVGITYGKIL